MRRFAGLAMLSIVAEALAAQSTTRPTVRVVEVDGRPVPYALVSLSGGNSALADEDGRVTVNVPVRDTMLVWARRIGYQPFEGRVPCGTGASGCTVELSRLSGILDTVRVVTRPSTPLSRTGFYDRVERVRKGAYTAEFITPEELEARDVSQVSRVLEGRRFIRLQIVGPERRMAVLGRAGCPVTNLVDGQRMTNMVEDTVNGTVPTSINSSGSRPRTHTPKLSTDEVAKAARSWGSKSTPAPPTRLPS